MQPKEYRSIDEPPPAYASASGTEQGTLHSGKSPEPSASRIGRSFTKSSVTKRVGLGLSASADKLSHFWQHKIWPAITGFRFSKRQTYAFLLLASAGFCPFMLFGTLYSGGGFYDSAFAAKTVACGNVFGTTPPNSTVEGIEGFFALDASFGIFTFSQAKILDVAWDIIIGRGLQLCAWLVSYRVFTDALLRLIERHPAPYKAFMQIGLEGACLASAGTLLKQLFQQRSKRTWALYLSMLITTLYVLSIPTLLSAMTGYNSRTIAWVSVGDDDNITPASTVSISYVVGGTWNETFKEPTCEANDQLIAWSGLEHELNQQCKCKTPNGSVMSRDNWARLTLHQRISNTSHYGHYRPYDCIFNYTGNTQTFRTFIPDMGTHNCNMTEPITIDNKSYPVGSLNYTFAFCWQGKAYDETSIMNSMRCLPDTAHPSYTWGFSSMLAAMVLILQLLWSLMVYIIWQDAQYNSKLVQSGVKLSGLKTAFLLTESAKRQTELDEGKLIRKDKKELEKELFGTRKRNGAQIQKDMLQEDAYEQNKRAMSEESESWRYVGI